MSTPTVIIVGTNFTEFELERDKLDAVGVTLELSDAITSEDVARDCAGADVLLVGARPTLDQACIRALSARGIVRYGVGVERVDVDEARRRGIVVANVPRYGAEAVALHAVALVLAAVRRLLPGHHHVWKGGWGLAPLKPLRLPASTTVLVVGCGAIGSAVVSRLLSLGFDVHVHDPWLLDAPAGVTMHRELVPALAVADVVTLHVPGNTDGRPLISGEAIQSMKADSALVNTARGTLVDEAALVEALRGGRLGFAALDVFAAEPPDLDAFGDVADRVLLSPHAGWYTEESEQDLRTQAVDDALRILAGEPPANPVG